MRGKRGFALLELLIVVAIISIITAIAAPNFSESLRRARETTCIAYRQAIQSSVYGYIRVKHLTTGDTVPPFSEMVDDGALPEVFECPSGGVYVWNTPTLVGIQTPFVNCSIHFVTPP